MYRWSLLGFQEIIWGIDGVTNGRSASAATRRQRQPRVARPLATGTSTKGFHHEGRAMEWPAPGLVRLVFGARSCCFDERSGEAPTQAPVQPRVANDKCRQEAYEDFA